MVFSSLVFLYQFLPLNLLLYFAWKNETSRNVLLTVLSLMFYAWGEPVWITLLVYSATFDYFAARLIERSRGTRGATFALAASVTSNVALLAVFKYSGFVVETLNRAAGTHFVPPSFSLPIGISFYTFQTISYVVDVYRGNVRAQCSWIKFMMFVSLFHQLVAGPIVRYIHIANEIEHRLHLPGDFSRGVTRMCMGLFKKVCIANVAGELVHKYMDGNLGALSVGESWLGLIAYTLQIYFDFSGYSDMAIGLGLMFGFHYHENFDHPYVARSVIDFWRRWHISLSTFFRDYVYIPLGGKDRFRNLFIVWALTGLWHGASWNFVLWGVYYGLFIAVERLVLRRVLDALPRIFQHAYLLFVVVLGWALFYFTDLARLRTYLGVMFGCAPLIGADLVEVLREHVFWFALAIVLCVPMHRVVKRWVDDDAPAWIGAARVAVNVGILLVATSMLVGKSYNPFLYFRF